MKRLVFLLLTLVLLLSVIPAASAANVPVTGIQTAGRTVLKVGETVHWSASAQPANATDKWLYWVSGNPGVATVDQSGNITALKGGQSNITITAKNGVKKTLLLTVGDVPVTGISTAGKTTIGVGDTVKWTASVLPTNATNKFLYWAAGNPSVATVDQNGNITAHKPGQCNISITAANGVQKIIMLTVKSSTASDALLADGTYVIATKLDTGFVLDISGAGKSNGDNLQIWERNNSPAQMFQITHLGDNYYKIVNTNSGKALEAQWGGTTPETNVCQNDYSNLSSQRWKIQPARDNSYYIINMKSGLFLDVDNAYTDSGTNVKLFEQNEAYEAQKWYFTKVAGTGSSANYGGIAVTGISTAGKTTINVGDRVKWTASVAPSNATNKSLWWTAGNPGVATVDQSGWITAHKAGQCHITVKAANGVKKTVMLNVTRGSSSSASASSSNTSYHIPVTGISTGGKTTINVGDTVKWTASVVPANATNKSLSWAAGNPGVATVDQYGNITAHKSGQCHITVTATNGVKKTVMLNVTANYKSQYLSVLQSNRSRILFSDWMGTAGKVAISDINRDSIPELIFVTKNDGSYYLHIYSIVGGAAKKVLSTLVSVDAGGGAQYSLFASTNGAVLYTDFYTELGGTEWSLLQLKADGTIQRNQYLYSCTNDVDVVVEEKYSNNGKTITKSAFTAGANNLKGICGKRLVSYTFDNAVEGVRNDSAKNTLEMTYEKAVSLLSS